MPRTRASKPTTDRPFAHHRHRLRRLALACQCPLLSGWHGGFGKQTPPLDYQRQWGLETRLHAMWRLDAPSEVRTRDEIKGRPLDRHRTPPSLLPLRQATDGRTTPTLTCVSRHPASIAPAFDRVAAPGGLPFSIVYPFASTPEAIETAPSNASTFESMQAPLQERQQQATAKQRLACAGTEGRGKAAALATPPFTFNRDARARASGAVTRCVAQGLGWFGRRFVEGTWAWWFGGPSLLIRAKEASLGDRSSWPCLLYLAYTAPCCRIHPHVSLTHNTQNNHHDTGR